MNGNHASGPERETEPETPALDKDKSAGGSEHDLRTVDDDNAHDTDTLPPPSPEERAK